MSSTMLIRAKGDAETWSPTNTPTRILVLLLDREFHELTESWDYLCESIMPQMAVRAYIRGSGTDSCRAEREDIARVNVAVALEEGYRNRILSTVRDLESNGFIEVIRGEERSGSNHRWNESKFKIRITDAGFAHAIGQTKRAYVCKEILSGLARKRLSIKLTYLGKPQ